MDVDVVKSWPFSKALRYVTFLEIMDKETNRAMSGKRKKKEHMYQFR